MTRLLFENDERRGRSGGSAVTGDEETSRGRSGVSRNEESGRARAGRLREDPSGRRSLTGLEFRRQRSI
jgi:hypothetical protein